MSGQTPFLLSKWYFDFLDDRGNGMIGYVASLRWGKLKLDYEGIIPIGNGNLKETGRFLNVKHPSVLGNEISWKFSQGTGRWVANSPAVHARLLDAPNGRIDWNCCQPSAVVTIEGQDIQMQGIGYAEKIELTIFPGNLPIKTLYWGRYVSLKNAIVWIRWIGPEPRLLLYFNSSLIEGAGIDEFSIAFDNYRLTLPRQTCRKGTVQKNVFSGFKKIASLLPATSLSLFEEKWSGAGALHYKEEVIDNGNIIHEKVSWP